MNEEKLPLGRLILLLGSIVFATAISIQNFQPFVTLYFLNVFSIPIPLSVTILVAFVGGGIVAFVFNQISFWLEDRREAEFDPSFDPNFTAEPPRSTANPNSSTGSTSNNSPKQSYTGIQDSARDLDRDTYEYPPRTSYQKNDEEYDDEEEDDDRNDVIDVKYIKKPEDF